MITFVITAELGSSLETTRHALEKALKESGAKLPEHQWVPDCDTIADAYDDDTMRVEVLNPVLVDRRAAAQELLDAHQDAGSILRPGLWYAATILNPSLSDGDSNG